MWIDEVCGVTMGYLGDGDECPVWGGLIAKVTGDAVVVMYIIVTLRVDGF